MNSGSTPIGGSCGPAKSRGLKPAARVFPKRLRPATLTPTEPRASARAEFSSAEFSTAEFNCAESTRGKFAGAGIGCAEARKSFIKGPFSLFLAISIAALSATAGCSQYIDPNVPAPIRPMVEPDLGRVYLLYRPSHYNAKRAWPLVIACHASFPDSPGRQIRAWTALAESRGFLVAVPRLQGVSSSSRPTASKRVQLLREDERQILSTVQHIRAGHTVSEDRVFIAGWAGGAHAALHTGLRNPGLFRAIGLISPRFSASFLGDAEPGIDRSQPIFVNYSVSDVLRGGNGGHCVSWLRGHSVDLYEDQSGMARKADTDRVIEFFEDIIRKHVWIRIDVFPAEGGSDLAARFKVRTPYEPASYHWEFGDGEESPVAEPIHAYPAPGEYTVVVTTRGSDGREHRRSTTISVP